MEEAWKQKEIAWREGSRDRGRYGKIRDFMGRLSQKALMTLVNAGCFSKDSRDLMSGMEPGSKNGYKRQEDGPAKCIINMISRGSTDGDSNRARKSWSRQESLGVEGYEMSLVKTALYGFAGHSVQLQGEMLLPITLGSGDLKKKVISMFTIVDAPSSYNFILGRWGNLEEISHPQGSVMQKRLKLIIKGQERVGKMDVVEEGRCVMWRKPREKNEEIELEPGEEGKSTKIARDLEAGLAEQLKICLVKNANVFAWSPFELVGISSHIAEHKLNVVSGSRSIKQKKRHFGEEKDKMIAEQVQELLRAGHIKEVKFPTWLSNVVLVPKATGNWKMCVDFRDLNKACPKDCYPLPRIDQLVDSTSRFELLCFMDAYHGYHQIPLAREDQDNVSFITSGGTFCYVVMSFGLKNSEATYQRMMDKVFQKQIGQNVEVYVGDILIKSRARDCFIEDMDEAFATIRQYEIKLNPLKCMFGVKSGKFLGFMVIEIWIEVNPEKVKMLWEMPSPTSIWEFQWLTGRITALYRFIDRSAHRSYHFFQVLRKA
ncbi:uncharacterized protein [Henckelia pumila]|uniref:uncharacterized protein n=1 Tax=Henckelia pumila TaxID=405737 RepID=UPI003C6DE6D3